MTRSLLIASAVAISLSGCASILTGLSGLGEPKPDPRLTRIAYYPDPAGVRIEVPLPAPTEPPATGSWEVRAFEGLAAKATNEPASYGFWAGLALDALATSNAVLLLGKFRTDGDAYLVASGVALAAIWGDGLLSMVNDEYRASSRVAMPPGEVAIAPAGQSWRLAITGKLGREGDKLVARVPVPASYLGVPVTIRLRAQDGSVVGETAATLAREPVAPPTPAPLAARPGRKAPPELKMRVNLEDPEHERVVSAELGGTLVVTVANEGKGPARAIDVGVTLASGVPGLTVPGRTVLGDLNPGESRTVRIALGAGPAVPDATVSLRVTAEDSGGFDAPPRKLSFFTRALRLPDLVVEQVGVDDHKDGLAERGEQLEILAVVRNRGQGKARNVSARFVVKDPAVERSILLTDADQLALGDLAPGAWSIATYSIVVKNAYEGSDKLPLALDLQEQHPQARRKADLAVVLNQAVAKVADDLVMPAFGPGGTIAGPVGLAVDVDQPLPPPGTWDPDAAAVVIGIERYNSQVPSVPFAQRDAAQVREHLVRILGVKPENIIYLANEQATKGGIQTALEGQLPGMVAPGRSHVYVYYAGHGAPDPESKAPFLVPHDGNPAFAKQSCYPMSSFYAALGQVEAKSVTVMLDACFSGMAGRGDKAVGLLANARPMSVQLKDLALPPGVALLAAATGEQVSSGYPQMRHGLFTYFLLKGLRGEASKTGKVTLTDLGNYVAREVPPLARRQGRQQTPVALGVAGGRVLVDR